MTRPAADAPAARGAPHALALACAGFAAIGPLVLISPKALWIAGVVIAIAHVLQRCAGGRMAAARGLVGDLAHLRALWLIALLGLASAAWAVVPEHSLVRGLRLFLEFAVGAVIIGLAATADARHARLYLKATALGLVVAAPLCIADMLLDGWLLFWAHSQLNAPNAYNRGAAFASVAVVPIAVLLWQQGSRLWLVPFVAAVVAFILVADSDSAKFVLPAALLGALTACWRWTRALPVLAFAIALVAIPLLLPQPLNGPVGCAIGEERLNLLHRLGIWNFVDSAIGERPWLGWGLEASRKIPGGTTYLAVPDCGVPISRPYVHERLPLHPHDFALNIWLELGAAGAFLLLWSLLDWARRLFRLPAGRAAALCALGAGAFLPATINFGMWQGWWLTALFVLVTLCLLAPRLAADPVEAGVRAAAKRPSSESLIRAGRTPSHAI